MSAGRPDRRTVRVLASHALAALGMSLPWPLLLVTVADRTHSDVLLGATGAARLLPYVVLSWAAGRLADRGRRDRVVRATLVLRLLSLAVAAAALASDHVLVAVLAAAAAVAVATPAYPALAAAVPALAGDGRRRATELLVTVEVASFVVGPAVGGLMLPPVTRGFVLPVALALTALAWLLFRGVALPAEADPTPEERSGVLRLVRTVRGVRVALGAVVLVNVVDGLLVVALLPVVARLWDGGDTAYGVASGVLGFGALAGPLVLLPGPGTRRVGLGLLLVGVPLVLVAGSPVLLPALAPLALVGAASVQVEAVATGLLQDGVPDRSRASVLGFADTAMVAAGMVGALAGPTLVTVLGPRLVLVVVGLAVAVVVLGTAAASVRSPGGRAAAAAAPRPRQLSAR